MKLLKNILFMLTVVVGLSLAVSAQKNDGQNKPPPKERPPVINPQPKNPPPDSNKPKKPGFAVVIFKDLRGDEWA
ncbi:MAG: hypothetical protein ABJA02_10680 [Acidobacteriota bacterium]